MNFVILRYDFFTILSPENFDYFILVTMVAISHSDKVTDTLKLRVSMSKSSFSFNKLFKILLADGIVFTIQNNAIWCLTSIHHQAFAKLDLLTIKGPKNWQLWGLKKTYLRISKLDLNNFKWVIFEWKKYFINMVSSFTSILNSL